MTEPIEHKSPPEKNEVKEFHEETPAEKDARLKQESMKQQPPEKGDK